MSATVGGVRRQLAAEFPREALQRLLLGPVADTTPGSPLPGLAPLPAALGAVETLMVLTDPARWRPPWQSDHTGRPGEEEPERLARALNVWWAAEGAARAAVVGTDEARSPRRWEVAPRADVRAALVLPADGFPAGAIVERDALARSAGSLTVVDAPAGRPDAMLLVLVSAEAPARFGARLRRLAADEALRGKLLAAWCLSGPVRADLPALLLAEGNLAGVALAPEAMSEVRAAPAIIAGLARERGARGPARVETLGGPFVWFF
jgi:hypothetical protein